MNSQSMADNANRLYPPQRNLVEENTLHLLKGKRASRLPNYLSILYFSAKRIYFKLNKTNKASKNEVIVNTLRELLTCKMRYLVGIYLSIFLQKDYKDQQMDSRVYNYLRGINNTYNELLGLSEEICRFLRKEKVDRQFDQRLFKIRFDRMRLKAPPISDNESADASKHYENYARHVMEVMDAFMAEVTCLNQSRIEIKGETFKCYDNLKGFQKASGKLIKKYILKSSERRGVEQDSGACTLVLEGGKSIRLDPIIIPLYNRSRKTRLASLVKFGGYMEENVCPMVYRELVGDGMDFNTNNNRLQNRIYYKKGQVAEDPNFSYQFRIGGQDTIIQLYKGDIFDLNFLEGMKHNKVSAMVNILYADLDNKTRLFQSLKNLTGDPVIEELKNLAIDNRKLDKDRIYTTKSGKLNFKYIFHCPIYDTKEEKNSGLPVITAAIENILKKCKEKKVEWLIVPAMGSFYAGQIRHKVAETWCEQLKAMARGKRSPLKRVIFSFINEETCEVYRNYFRMKNINRFAACHLPVSRMHSYMDTSVQQKNRLNYALNLSGYLYGFVVAMSLRALMWEKINKRINSEPYVMTPAANKFISEVRRRGGMEHEKDMKPEFVKSMNPGDWRSLAKLGYDAIKTSAWHFDIWYQGSTMQKLDAFKSFLSSGKGAVDFPNIRNRMTHSPWFDIHESDLAEYANEAVKGITGVIENMPFLDQEKNRMILVDNFSVNEDERVGWLEYRDLGGQHDSPPSIKKEIKLDFLKGRLFENGIVYLLEKLKDGSLRALNMHPFLVYGPCPGCGKKRLFVWRDFAANDGENLKIKYGSTTCNCRNINNDRIAGFSHTSLEERFINLLNNLKSDEVPPTESDNI